MSSIETQEFSFDWLAKPNIPTTYYRELTPKLRLSLSIPEHCSLQFSKPCSSLPKVQIPRQKVALPDIPHIGFNTAIAFSCQLQPIDTFTSLLLPDKRKSPRNKKKEYRGVEFNPTWHNYVPIFKSITIQYTSFNDTAFSILATTSRKILVKPLRSTIGFIGKQVITTSRKYPKVKKALQFVDNATQLSLSEPLLAIDIRGSRAIFTYAKLNHDFNAGIQKITVYCDLSREEVIGLTTLGKVASILLAQQSAKLIRTTPYMPLYKSIKHLNTKFLPRNASRPQHSANP